MTLPDPPPAVPGREPRAEIGSPPMAIPLENSDGRHARRDRGKQVAIEAAIEIFREGGVIESMAQLAERSGISERTLFRYFTNQDGLIDAIAVYAFPQLAEYFTIEVPEGSLENRMRALVNLRIRHAQVAGPMARTLERFARQFSIAAELRRGREEFFHQQMMLWLGDDAQNLSDEVIALLDTLLDFSSLDKLLATLGPRTEHALHSAVMTLIDT